MNLLTRALLLTAVVALHVRGSPRESEKGAPDERRNAAPEGNRDSRTPETRPSAAPAPAPAESGPDDRESGPREKASGRSEPGGKVKGKGGGVLTRGGGRAFQAEVEGRDAGKPCSKRQTEKEYGDSSAMKVVAKQAELQTLLQQLYQAEATVKMEAGEVARTQEAAEEAEAALEEATNKVRMLSAELRGAQESAAAAAMRAHTAQLQLSAHDQLMFTARQRVDALSAQMVSVQADLASAQRSFTLSNSSLRLEEQGAAGPDRPCSYVYRDLGAYTPPPPPPLPLPPSPARNKAEASGAGAPPPLPPPESYPFKWGEGSGSVPGGGESAASSPEKWRPVEWKEVVEYAPPPPPPAHRLLVPGPRSSSFSLI